MSLREDILEYLGRGSHPFWALKSLGESGAAVRAELEELGKAGRVSFEPDSQLYHLVDPAPPLFGRCDDCDGHFRVTWPDGARIVEVLCPDCGSECVFERDDLYEPRTDPAPASEWVPPPSPVASLVDAIDASKARAVMADTDGVSEDRPAPRGHPAHGVGPPWSERIADLERADDHLARRLVALEELAIGDRLLRLEHPRPAGPIAPPLGVHVEALREREAIATMLESFPESSWETPEDRRFFLGLCAAIRRAEHLASPSPTTAAPGRSER